MTVTLRTDQLSKGRKSIYLDVYVNPNHSYQKRLGIYLEPEKNKDSKERNKDKWKLAQEIRSQYEIKMLNNTLGKVNPREKFQNSFSKYFESFVKERERTGVDFDTWESVQKHLRRYQKKDILFTDLNESLLESFKHYLLSVVSQNSAHTYFNRFKRAIHNAFRDKMIEQDYAVLVKSPRVVNPKREFLTEDEVKSIFNTECRYTVLKNAFLFSVLTGLRWSDVQNLKWENVIDSDDNESSLSYQQRKTKDFELLPINEKARAIIGKRKESHERVFVGLRYSAYTNVALARWMMDAGITKKITFHCARHTHATLLINKGVDIFTVSKMLGHQDISTTQIYAKIVNKTKVEATNKLTNLI